MQAAPKPEIAASAHDRVYRGLRTRIMHGQMAPGQALTLRGIGREFDVSMTPAREAVNRLVAEGALTMSSSGRVSTPELSNERIEELAALRALIEVELASRALPRAHIALIDRLQTINATIADVVSNRDSVGYIRTNLEFHRTLYLRAQAPAMLAMAETVWLQGGAGWETATVSPPDHRGAQGGRRAGSAAGGTLGRDARVANAGGLKRAPLAGLPRCGMKDSWNLDRSSSRWASCSWRGLRLTHSAGGRACPA